MKQRIIPALLIATALAAALVVALTGSTTSAQTGDGYDLSWNVIAGGGTGPLTGDGFSVRSTVGQTAIGLDDGPTTDMCAGYWCSAKVDYDVFLPAVLKNY